MNSPTSTPTPSSSPSPSTSNSPPPTPSKKEITEWEEKTLEERLEARHKIKNIKASFQKIETEKKTLESRKQLSAAIKKWSYLPDEIKGAPNVEIAWIIFSQIAWKGTEIDEEELWEDLPETDPAQIINLEKRGPEEQTLIPDETILLLHNILTDLEHHGIKIKDKIFSKNWERKGKKHTGGGRFKEIIDKNDSHTNKNNSKLMRVIKTNKPELKSKKKGKPDGKKKGSLLKAFFGIF